MEGKQGILVQGLKKSYWIGKKETQRAVDAGGQNGRWSHDIVTEVLCGLDFEMEPGGFYAIMGKSGCGKSTLMSILCGLEKADTGKCFVNGRRIDTMKPQELAYYRNQEIGIVFQAFYLDETRSLLDNVAMPGGYAGMSLKDRKKRALELLTLVGLTAEKKKRPSQVSGGQQQRAAIARALMNHPAYLFLDEPTGNLDEENTRHVMELFAGLHREGMGILMVTHDPCVASYAKHVVMMEQGKLSVYCSKAK